MECALGVLQFQLNAEEGPTDSASRSYEDYRFFAEFVTEEFPDLPDKEGFLPVSAESLYHKACSTGAPQTLDRADGKQLQVFPVFFPTIEPLQPRSTSLTRSPRTPKSPRLPKTPKSPSSLSNKPRGSRKARFVSVKPDTLQHSAPNPCWGVLATVGTKSDHLKSQPAVGEVLMALKSHLMRACVDVRDTVKTSHIKYKFAMTLDNIRTLDFGLEYRGSKFLEHMEKQCEVVWKSKQEDETLSVADRKEPLEALTGRIVTPARARMELSRQKDLDLAQSEVKRCKESKLRMADVLERNIYLRALLTEMAAQKEISRDMLCVSLVTLILLGDDSFAAVCKKSILVMSVDDRTHIWEKIQGTLLKAMHNLTAKETLTARMRLACDHPWPEEKADDLDRAFELQSLQSIDELITCSPAAVCLHEWNAATLGLHFAKKAVASQEQNEEWTKDGVK
eukprot:gene21217-25491_t